MSLAIIREWYILVPIIVITIFTIGVGLWASKQSKKRENLMSKKKLEEKEMKEALEMFEQELSRELEKIEQADNPLEALLNLRKDSELDPIKDFDKILVRPKGEYEQ